MTTHAIRSIWSCSTLRQQVTAPEELLPHRSPQVSAQIRPAVLEELTVLHELDALTVNLGMTQAAIVAPSRALCRLQNH